MFCLSLRTIVGLRSNKQKPRMKLHGAWAFNWALHLHILDEPVMKDSSSTIEMLAQLIEDVVKQAAARGVAMPSHLLVCVPSNEFRQPPPPSPHPR